MRELFGSAMPVSKKEKPDLSKKVHEVPHKPGVYLMRDRFNRVIYVGKARDCASGSRLTLCRRSWR